MFTLHTDDEIRLALLLVVAAAIVVLAMGVLVFWLFIGRKSTTSQNYGSDDDEEHDQAQAIAQEAEMLPFNPGQHIEVHAVMALASAFSSNPDLVQNVELYSREVVLATLYHRLNQLSETIKLAQDWLTHYSRLEIEHPSEYTVNICELERQYDILVTQLLETFGKIRDFAQP